jgi:hypothetical protein
MVAARWRLLRILAIERETLEAAVDKHDPSARSPAACAALAFHDLANNSRTLDLLSRYESRFDRQFSRALNLFRKLASDAQPEPLAAPVPATVQTHPPALQLVPKPNGPNVPPNEKAVRQTDLIPVPDAPDSPPDPPIPGHRDPAAVAPTLEAHDAGSPDLL